MNMYFACGEGSANMNARSDEIYRNRGWIC